MANPLGINGSDANKPFRAALRLALANAKDARGLRAIAEKLLEKAADGELAAIALLVERLDGKVAQPVGGSDELGPTRLHITWNTSDHKDLTQGVLDSPVLDLVPVQTEPANQELEAKQSQQLRPKLTQSRS